MKTGCTSLLAVLMLNILQSSGQPTAPLQSSMDHFIGAWKSEKVEGRNFENYRLLEWDLNHKTINFYESPSREKKWRVKSVFAFNPVTQEIESHDYTDWGNIVSCKITTKSDGITRFMTVYNAQDKKIHFWISDWTLLDDNTWQSAAREVDADGKTIQPGWQNIYRRIRQIPDSVILK